MSLGDIRPGSTASTVSAGRSDAGGSASSRRSPWAASSTVSSSSRSRMSSARAPLARRPPARPPALTPPRRAGPAAAAPRSPPPPPGPPPRTSRLPSRRPACAARPRRASRRSAHCAACAAATRFPCGPPPAPYAAARSRVRAVPLRLGELLAQPLQLTPGSPRPPARRRRAGPPRPRRRPASPSPPGAAHTRRRPRRRGSAAGGRRPGFQRPGQLRLGLPQPLADALPEQRVALQGGGHRVARELGTPGRGEPGVLPQLRRAVRRPSGRRTPPTTCATTRRRTPSGSGRSSASAALTGPTGRLVPLPAPRSVTPPSLFGGLPQEPAPGLSTSSIWSTALHQRQRTDSMVSLTTSRSSTLGSPARSRCTYSTTFDERVTSNRVRLPQRVQRHRVRRSAWEPSS